MHINNFVFLFQEEGLSEVGYLEDMQLGDGTAEAKLRSVLENLSSSCQKYVMISKSSGPLGFTRLDKNRLKQSISAIVSK